MYIGFGSRTFHHRESLSTEERKGKRGGYRCGVDLLDRLGCVGVLGDEVVLEEGDGAGGCQVGHGRREGRAPELRVELGKVVVVVHEAMVRVVRVNLILPVGKGGVGNRVSRIRFTIEGKKTTNKQTNRSSKITCVE